jgi:methionyl aminopeptidase
VKIMVKSADELAIMTEGGRKLARIKSSLKNKIKAGVSAMEIDNLAQQMIAKSGGKPSFKMVRDYKWATCVNVNEGVVHGIPRKEHGVCRRETMVSVDVGLFYQGIPYRHFL